MIKYIVKRLLLLIPVLIGITFLSFAMMRLAGVDGIVVHEQDELKQALERVLEDKSIGIVLLTEKFGREFPAIIDETRKNMGWISRFLSSMRNGSQEWQPEIWE